MLHFFYKVIVNKTDCHDKLARTVKALKSVVILAAVFQMCTVIQCKLIVTYLYNFKIIFFHIYFMQAV